MRVSDERARVMLERATSEAAEQKSYTVEQGVYPAIYVQTLSADLLDARAELATLRAELLKANTLRASDATQIAAMADVIDKRDAEIARLRAELDAAAGVIAAARAIARDSARGMIMGNDDGLLVELRAAVARLDEKASAE